MGCPLALKGLQLYGFASMQLIIPHDASFGGLVFIIFFKRNSWDFSL